MNTPDYQTLSTLPDSALFLLAEKYPTHSDWNMEAYRYLAFRIAMVQGIVIKENKTN